MFANYGNFKEGQLSRLLGQEVLAKELIFNQEQSDFDLMCKHLYFLVKYEIELEKKLNSSSPIPFHHVLLQNSALYRRTWEICQILGLKPNPAMKSFLHLVREFQPFSKELNCSVVKSSMNWVANQSESGFFNREIVKFIQVYNWSYFHEMWHSIYFHLVPFTNEEDISKYFVFFEAMVTHQEAILAFELGDLGQRVLRFSRTVNNAPVNPKISLKGSRDDFAEAIIEYYIDRMTKDSETGQWSYRHWITEYWLSKSQIKNYPKKFKDMNATLGLQLPTYSIPSYDPNYLMANPQVIFGFINWYRSLVLG